MWCNFGDPVCAVGSDPVNITAHWSYYEEYSEVASRWIVATALGLTDVELDLNLDGQNESVVLTGTPPQHAASNDSSNNTSESDHGGDADEGIGLKNTPSGILGILGLVVVVTIGLVTI